MRTDGLSDASVSMPTAKGKGGPAPQRYRPASEFDDATLAQKREYWRNKKRQQRARLSVRTEQPTQGGQDSQLGKTPLCRNAPAVVNASLSSFFSNNSKANNPPQRNSESFRTADVSQRGNTAGDSPTDTAESQKEKWLQTMQLNKVLPPSCSVTSKAAAAVCVPAQVKSLGLRGAVSRPVTSTMPHGRTQLNTNHSSSVPQIRVTRNTNGSSANNTTPQPRVSMQQGSLVPKTQPRAQVASRIYPKLILPANVTTGPILASSSRIPITIRTANAATRGETKSALVPQQMTRGVCNSKPPPESEEQKAARRREHWRIKKREQRAKVAAQIAEVRARTETASQRQITAQRPGLRGGAVPQHPPSRLFLRKGQKQFPNTPCLPVKRENHDLQSGSATLPTVNPQVDSIKVEIPCENKIITQTDIKSNVMSVKKPMELRKLQSYLQLSNVSRGITRFKTPRQRSLEAQKNFMNQRSLRCKSTLVGSVLGSRNMPKIDPNDTYEQIIAKRREYWRVKKREQRAKLSVETKDRLKEKDCLMRRAKRYQSILEEMRRARAMGSGPTGRGPTHASETIGGFIKEDGTVSIGIPQVPTNNSTSQNEPHVVSNKTLIAKPQLQPNVNPRCVAPVRINPPPPALRPAQVRVTYPLSGQSVNKPSKLISIRPRIPIQSTAPLAIQTAGQLRLSHPHTSQIAAASGGSNAGSTLGGCVMKMAVSSSASTPSLSALTLEPGLTEEERMARKREYWRVKKREQRAARVLRMRQGVLQARANAARRKTQRQVTSAQLSRWITRQPGNAQPHPRPNNNIININNAPVTTHASAIKQESEFMPAIDPVSQPEEAICADIKPPVAPTLTQAPQSDPKQAPDPEPAVNADSQATTLLAVASMKKLLEESLSTVTESKGVQTGIKTETEDGASEQEMKPNSTQLFFENDEVTPTSADLIINKIIKSWQPDADSSPGPQSPKPKVSPQTSPPPDTNETANPHHTCEHSSQTRSNFIVNPSTEACGGPPSPRRTQRLRAKKEIHQNCCPAEPPARHNLPGDRITQPPQQKQHSQLQVQSQNSSSTSAQKHSGVVTETYSGPSSLQRKREYWKLMKRQQRARLKDRHRHTDCSKRIAQRNRQAPGPVIINPVKAVNPPSKPAVQPKPPVAAVSVMPAVLTVSPTVCKAERSPETLQIKSPVSNVPRNEPKDVNSVGPSQNSPACLKAPEYQKHPVTLTQKCPPKTRDEDSSVPSLQTLKPPENPLLSINLQSIESPAQTPRPTLPSPIKIPCARPQTQLSPISTMVPPKPVAGESSEEFLRRKREYWRIKKKEQRARKAIQDRGNPQRRVSTNWRPILPVPDQHTQDSGQCVNSSEESEHQMSAPVDTDPQSFAYSNYAAPVEDESELLFSDYDSGPGEFGGGPVPDAVWRSRYLMDHDPLNQLLVCMVCGELQYSHSVEGVTAHIDEAHPETLQLGARDRQQILDNWDEQVSRRERFFTSQLQRHSGATADGYKN